MTDIKLVRQVLDDAATLRGVPVERVSVSVGDAIDLRVEGVDATEKVSTQWVPEGGGIIEWLDLAPALAHHLRLRAQREVDHRAQTVTVARRALEAAEKAHADAVALRDRLAAIVDEGVADARARRASKSGA